VGTRTAQIAAAIVSAHPGSGYGYTIAFVMGALGLVAALAPTLVITRRRAGAVALATA
jgi:hypothetical protein